MYHPHNYCRACGWAKPGAEGIKSSAGTEALMPVFDLGIQPLANDFARSGEPRAGYAPLAVLLCPRCHLAQLSATVDPAILYARNYAYVTSPSETMLRHFNCLRVDIDGEGWTENHNLIEIGSNDGLMLDHFQKHGWKVLGIDPAPNLCAEAHKRGVETVNDFFGVRCAQSLRLTQRPDVIIARHVFCHCDDWRDFVSGLELLAGKDTLICIETPYVQDLLDKTEFDTCLLPSESVIASDGPKLIKDVLQGHFVFTHTGKLSRVTHKFERDYCGSVIQIYRYGQSNPLRVTLDHPVYAERKGKIGFFAANTLSPGDFLLNPGITRTDERQAVRVLHKKPRGKAPSSVVATAFPVDSALAEIGGFYLAEGFHDCRGRGSHTAHFAFGKSKAEKELAERCSAALKSHGAKGGIRWTRFGWHVHTYGPMAKMLSEQFGKGAANKGLPPWAFTMNETLTEVLVRAYIHGDGYVYRNGNYWRASTVSERLAQGVAVLANKLGYPVSVNIGRKLGPKWIHKNPRITESALPPIDILIRLSPKKKIKVWHDGTCQRSLIKRVETVHYSGKVYNLEVAGDNSYVTPQSAVHNCYHEHLSYLSIKSVEALLLGTTLHLHRVIRYAIHGGAVMLCLRRNDCGTDRHNSVQQFLDAEDVGPERWLKFKASAFGIIDDLKRTVNKLRLDGKSVAALGASAKFTVLANACGFRRKDIAFVADTTLGKWYSTVPGTDIPVCDDGIILRELPDYVLVGAWNFRAEVLAKNELARSKGVHFIFPIPEVEVI